MISDKPYTPLPEDQECRETQEREAKRTKTAVWQSYNHGQTTILQDSSQNLYKCPRPSCPYTNTNPQSVVIHRVRHCVKQEPVPMGTQELLEAMTSVEDVPDAAYERQRDRRRRRRLVSQHRPHHLHAAAVFHADICGLDYIDMRFFMERVFFSGISAQCCLQSPTPFPASFPPSHKHPHSITIVRERKR